MVPSTAAITRIRTNPNPRDTAVATPIPVAARRTVDGRFTSAGDAPGSASAPPIVLVSSRGPELGQRPVRALAVPVVGGDSAGEVRDREDAGDPSLVQIEIIDGGDLLGHGLVAADGREANAPRPAVIVLDVDLAEDERQVRRR